MGCFSNSFSIGEHFKEIGDILSFFLEMEDDIDLELHEVGRNSCATCISNSRLL